MNTTVPLGVWVLTAHNTYHERRHTYLDTIEHHQIARTRSAQQAYLELRAVLYEDLEHL